jgi:hypothetical protein
MSTGYVLATYLKLYVFDILKELMTATKEQRYESFKLYGTTAE